MSGQALPRSKALVTTLEGRGEGGGGGERGEEEGGGGERRRGRVVKHGNGYSYTLFRSISYGNETKNRPRSENCWYV